MTYPTKPTRPARSQPDEPKGAEEALVLDIPADWDDESSRSARQRELQASALPKLLKAQIALGSAKSEQDIAQARALLRTVNF